jgi:hypothetical protein
MARRLLLILGLGRQTTASAFEVSRAHHLFDHADVEALLEAAVLAAIAATLVHRTVLLGQAHVLGVLLHGALEEALAALACSHTVVLTRGVVTAHSTQLTSRHHLLLMLHRCRYSRSRSRRATATPASGHHAIARCICAVTVMPAAVLMRIRVLILMALMMMMMMMMMMGR